VARALASELPGGDAAEFGVHRFDQPRQGRGVAVGPVVKQASDVAL
jgi:hypothetical protein